MPGQNDPPSDGRWDHQQLTKTQAASGPASDRSTGERIFNLYLYIQGEVIEELGAVAYQRDGTDEAKLAFLQSQSTQDYQQARRYPVPDRYQMYRDTKQPRPGLRYEAYQTLSRMGRHLELFDEVFQDLGAPPDPLSCITPIVDGAPRIQRTSRF